MHGVHVVGVRLSAARTQLIIKISKTGEGISPLMRRLGYSPDFKTTVQDEPSFSRRLGGTVFPRFHIYVTEESRERILKLHLDQNRPRYEGVAAHGGEYGGPLVEAEAKRIEAGLTQNT